MAEKQIDNVMRSMHRKRLGKKLLLTIVIYAIAFLYFFPILYMFLSGFKTEQQAVMPSLLFTPTHL